MAEGMDRIPYPDHPNRCQGIRRGSHYEKQCDFKAEEGSNYCKMHGGSPSTTPLKELNLYRIKKYANRISDLKAANGARTIDEELAILRMVLEEVLNKCEIEGEMGLMLYSSKISDLIRDIKGCVITADKLATKAGQLIGRGEAVVIAGKVVTILSEEIDDQEALGRIADRVLEAFTTPSLEELDDA